MHDQREQTCKQLMKFFSTWSQA